MSMTLKEFKEKLKGSKIKGDSEIVLHLESGDYGVSRLEYDAAEKKLRVCSADEIRRNTYKIMFVVTKDHAPFAFDTRRITANDDNDIILDIGEWQDKFLKELGIEGEVSEKTGSTAVECEERVPVDAGDGKFVFETAKVKTTSTSGSGRTGT